MILYPAGPTCSPSCTRSTRTRLCSRSLDPISGPSFRRPAPQRFMNAVQVSSTGRPSSAPTSLTTWAYCAVAAAERRGTLIPFALSVISHSRSSIGGGVISIMRGLWASRAGWVARRWMLCLKSSIEMLWAGPGVLGSRASFAPKKIVYEVIREVKE